MLNVTWIDGAVYMDYLECQKRGNYTTFWQPFFEQWEERWPARASLFPGIPMDQVLTAAQLEEKEIFKAALQKVLFLIFHAWYWGLTLHPAPDGQIP